MSIIAKSFLTLRAVQGQGRCSSDHGTMGWRARR